MKWLEEVLLEEKKINDADFSLLHVTDSPAEAVEVVVRSQDSLRKMDKTVSDDH